MPAKRELTMRQLRQMLRLHHDGLGAREIGRRLHVARSTIQDNLKRTQAAGLAWPLAPDLTDEVLEQRLFGRGGSKPSVRRRAEPDWAALARELKRPGVNLVVLWEEYRADFPGGYGYSRFCDLFREFEQRLSPVMRQTHAAGDCRAGEDVAILTLDAHRNGPGGAHGNGPTAGRPESSGLIFDLRPMTPWVVGDYVPSSL
jgi:Homeodomain-like domain